MSGWLAQQPTRGAHTCGWMIHTLSTVLKLNLIALASILFHIAGSKSSRHCSPSTWNTYWWWGFNIPAYPSKTETAVFIYSMFEYRRTAALDTVGYHCSISVYRVSTHSSRIISHGVCLVLVTSVKCCDLPAERTWMLLLNGYTYICLILLSVATFYCLVYLCCFIDQVMHSFN